MRRSFWCSVAILLIAACGLTIWRAWPGWRGRGLLEAGNEHLRARRGNAALERFERAGALARERADPRLEARALLGAAEVLYASLGELEAARERLESALALARQNGDKRLEADALSALGVFYWWYERRRERPLPEFYRPALVIYEEIGDERGMAEIRARIGVVHLAAGEYEAAAHELEASLEVFEKLDDEEGLGQVHGYLGALHAGIENAARAHEHYRRALEIARARRDWLEAANIEALIADLHLRQGEYERATTLLERLLEADDAPSIPRRNHLLSRGHAELHLGRPRAAAASYRLALEIDDESPGEDPRFRSRASTMLAHAHMQAGELDQAAAALGRAEAVPIAAKGWGETVLHTLARADLAAHRAEPGEALRHLLRAAEIEHRTFGLARSYFFQSQYRQIFERLFGLLAEGVAERDEAHALAFRFLEQMRYRSFRGLVVKAAGESEISADRPSTPAEKAALERVERLGRRLATGYDATLWERLRQAYGDYEDAVLRAELAGRRYRRIAEARPVTLADVRDALPRSTVMVEYVIASGRVFALAVSRRGVASAIVPLDAEALAAKVKLFRHQVESGAATWRRLAAELHDALLAPLAAEGVFDQASEVVLVPMGFLHDLPFAALDRDGVPLAGRYALVRAASATAWLRAGESTPREPRRTIAFGLEKSPVAALPPLPWAEREAANVAGITGGRAWLGEAASEAAFKRQAADAGWLHVAAHGVAEPGMPLHSGLFLVPGEGEDGRSSVREILELELRAELVTLSACQTGLARGASGRDEDTALEVDRLGFVEAFHQAGAKNVLATLMPVDDAASAVFMESFYRHLADGTPVQALAATRRLMLEGRVTLGEEPLTHPRFWAPFVLAR